MVSIPYFLYIPYLVDIDGTITGNDGLEAALMQSFDADGSSLDPCQLQNSSNTGQFSLVTSLTVVAQCDEMFVPVLKLIEWQNENFCSEFSRW